MKLARNHASSKLILTKVYFPKKKRGRKNIEVWHEVESQIEKIIPDTLEKHGSVYDMVNSGARGSIGNITQMVGMKGLIVNTQGETIQFPIISSYEGRFDPDRIFHYHSRFA